MDLSVNFLATVQRLTLFVLIVATEGVPRQPVTASQAALTDTAKPDCPRHCGNLTVPYPFGVGLGAGCSRSPEWYDILCIPSNNSSSPEDDPYTRAFLPYFEDMNGSMVEVISISETQVFLRNQAAYLCFNSMAATEKLSISFTIKTDSPYSVSATDNMLTVVGCHVLSTLNTGGPNSAGDAFCSTSCSSGAENITTGELCDGKNGCCRATIDKGMRSFTVNLEENNHAGLGADSPCGYAFLGDQDRFLFHGAPDLNDPEFVTRAMDNIPMVLDWVIAPARTCTEAHGDAASYACQQNTTCVDATESGIGGYRCYCLPGYQGNPYLSPGCSDINECANVSRNLCSKVCTNTPGNYTCSCPSGYSGDGWKTGTGCTRELPVIVKFALGFGIGTLFLFLGITLIYLTIRKRRSMKIKERFFQQNGGLLLKQLISPNQRDNMELMKVFTLEALKEATEGFSEARIVGRGGYGTVFKGILSYNQIIAIKRSRIVDQSQVEQFINELVLLARINHPNVVRLLGCCLEVEVPFLVYEFIPNGTLYEHAQCLYVPSWYSWNNCLRIATELGEALAYLHSIPLIHRDFKSSNILLDESYTTKISDFGASRLIPLNQTHLSTMVQGTLGYLDPEYYNSGQLTEKSDVYSYGVVVAELLTRKEPLLIDGQGEEGSYILATYFVKLMQEGNLFNILDAQLVSEAPVEQLVSIANLVQKCLNIKGEDRPTMREVVLELEQLRQAGLESDEQLEKRSNKDVSPFLLN